MTFTKTHSANRGTRTYKSEEGLVLYLPKSAGDQPYSFEVEGLNAPKKSERVSRVKMTPEERKAATAERRARNANLTPAQKIEAEEQRLAARAKQIADRKAKLAAEATA